MATLWKKIGQVEQRRPLLGVYDIPVEAMWLTEDIQTIEDMMRLMDRLQARTQEQRKTLRRLAWIMGTLKREWDQQLLYEYLAGVKLKPRPMPQTLSDVWRLISEALERIKERSGETKQAGA